MGKLLSVDDRKLGIVNFKCSRAEPTRAIYYGVFFRDRNSNLQVATGNFYAERKDAEMFIELRKTEGMKTDYFVVTLSVPISAEEGTQALGQDDLSSPVFAKTAWAHFRRRVKHK